MPLSQTVRWLDEAIEMIIEFEGKNPQIADNVFIAPNATLLGDVRVGEGANIWFGAVLRADHGTIIIGPGCSVQDNVTIHVNRGKFTTLDEDVTIGHGATIEGCHIGARSVIGMNAVVLPRAEIGEEVMIAAGSVVTEDTQIPPRTMAAGSPAKIKKEIGGSALAWIRRSAPVYHDLRNRYLAEEINHLHS